VTLMHTFFGFPSKNLSHPSQAVTPQQEKSAMTGQNGIACSETGRAEPVTTCHNLSRGFRQHGREQVGTVPFRPVIAVRSMIVILWRSCNLS
jgi:hypothetical protein